MFKFVAVVLLAACVAAKPAENTNEPQTSYSYTPYSGLNAFNMPTTYSGFPIIARPYSGLSTQVAGQYPVTPYAATAYPFNYNYALGYSAYPGFQGYNAAYSAPAYTPMAYSAPAYSAPAYTAPAYTAPAYTASAVSAPSYTAAAPVATTYSAAIPSYAGASYAAPSYAAPTYSSAALTAAPVASAYSAYSAPVVAPYNGYYASPVAYSAYGAGLKVAGLPNAHLAYVRK